MTPVARFVSTWPEVLAQPTALQRFHLAMGVLPDAVQEYLGRWSEAEPLRARAAFWGFALASTAGFRPLVPLKGGYYRMLGTGGKQCIMGFQSVEFETAPTGRATRARLEQVLDRAMGERAYILHVRKPLPESMDLDSVGRSVRLWLQAIDRGDWVGTNAVYEDGGVDLEITLTGGRSANKPRVFTQCPLTGLEHLSAVYERLVQLAEGAEEVSEGLPVILVLGAQPSFRLSAGHVLQSLYGLAARVDSCPEGTVSWYTDYNRSFFGDPENRHVGAVWWVQGRGDDELAPHAWAHINPWCAAPHGLARFPGWAYAPQGVSQTRDGKVSIEMAWAGAAVDWSLRP